ncbi:hypothetical protein LWI29_007956 [Acer saccharum]|uniref:Protein kinase domain-containing protein n=1 Tax=Acer saccharum TaxID=4024 RepID=A0AA39RR29_ACESA|nr:hypothetical protein LWI29_007956 [Acer saccharum]
MLPDGQQVAVKRLITNSKQRDEDFKNEVTLVAGLQHRNLVRLLGFCLEGKERILVFEFLSNSSLDNFIFGMFSLPIKILAWKRWNEGTALKVIDSTLREGSRNEMMKCINIGLLCVQESVSDRPIMASVIHMLNSNSAGTLPAPSKPGFFMQGSVILNASSSLEYNSTGSTESERRRIATAPL